MEGVSRYRPLPEAERDRVIIEAQQDLIDSLRRRLEGAAQRVIELEAEVARLKRLLEG